MANTTGLYTEVFFASIFAIVAASLWVEYTKGFIARTFGEHPNVLLVTAIIITLIPVLIFQFLFSKRDPSQN